MKAESCKRGINKNLDGTWDWTVTVWFGTGFFADVVLKGWKPFDSQQECTENMKTVLKKMGLDKTPIQSPSGYIFPNEVQKASQQQRLSPNKKRANRRTSKANRQKVRYSV